MVDLASNIAYLTTLLVGDELITLMAFIVLFSVALAVRDGLERDQHSRG
jgi:hypothetical protein